MDNNKPIDDHNIYVPYRNIKYVYPLMRVRIPSNVDCVRLIDSKYDIIFNFMVINRVTKLLFIQNAFPKEIITFINILFTKLARYLECQQQDYMRCLKDSILWRSEGFDDWKDILHCEGYYRITSYCNDYILHGRMIMKTIDEMKKCHTIYLKSQKKFNCGKCITNYCDDCFQEIGGCPACSVYPCGPYHYMDGYESYMWRYRSVIDDRFIESNC